MKEFLNKLKTPTKILSIVCIILVLTLFSKCNDANRLRDKNNQLTEQKDQLTEQRDSLLNEIQELNNLIKDLKLENALNNGNKLESKHEMEIKLIKCEKDNLRIANENSNLRREIANLKIKIKKLESE